MFKIEQTKLDGVFIIYQQLFIDKRGYFTETYNKADFSKLGLNVNFVQDNESSSVKGVLRGLHFQKEHTQGKLVRVVEGQVFDVAVDIRPNSKTFGEWVGVTLSAKEGNQLYIPEGFAHGFLVLSDEAKFVYKCTDFYDKSSEGGISWNDPTINIEWPKLNTEYIISDKDSIHPSFKEQSFEWTERWYNAN